MKREVWSNRLRTANSVLFLTGAIGMIGKIGGRDFKGESAQRSVFLGGQQPL
jgi:hypothetical protein